MKRYWVPPECMEGGVFSLEGEVFHHIHNVCRNDMGAKFEILCGDHKAYFVELSEVQKKRGSARVLEVREIAPLPLPHIHLYLSIPRPAKLDWIIEKTVELGVYSLTPFVSDYSFVRKVDSSLLKRRERWLKIVRGASQQSGRGELMPIEEPTTLDRILGEFNPSPANAGLFCYEGEASLTLRDALGQIQGTPRPGKLENLRLFVGSEGGFSSAEVQKFQSVGLDSVTLGEQILRVDTACVALVSILKYEFNLMGGR